MRFRLAAMGVAAASVLAAAGSAVAGLSHEFVVTDDLGTGLFGEGRIRFAVPSGSCSGADCLTLLDGIQITFGDNTFETGDIWGSPDEVVEATWDIDLTSWVLTGFFQFSEKSSIRPFVSFTDLIATNLDGPNVTSSVVVHPVTAPDVRPILASGLLALVLFAAALRTPT